ncbi:MAG: rsuA [Rhodospirillales bacterium]|nr:rsuA [Rhodospirillales bacterium]
MRLVRLIANLGYGSQKDVRGMIRDGRITALDGRKLAPDTHVPHDQLLFDGAPLDPPAGIVLMFNKPVDYTCSTQDPGRIVYDLLPERFRRRSPIVAPVGRLDRDTTGLLLLTDDGALLHRITSPRSRIAKIYEATLARPLTGDEAAVFAAGTLVLRSEKTPLAPATLKAIGERRARLTIVEGRYHQVKRMFAAVGNHVETLHRAALGGLTLGDLPSGKWRYVTAEEIARVFLMDL